MASWIPVPQQGPRIISRIITTQMTINSQLSKEQLHIIKAGRAAPNWTKSSLKAADLNCEVKIRDIHNKTARIETRPLTEWGVYCEFDETQGWGGNVFWGGGGRIENIFIVDFYGKLYSQVYHSLFGRLALICTQICPISQRKPLSSHHWLYL